MRATPADHALSIRRKIIQAANSRFDAHFGGCLSVADILAVLFGGVLNLSPGSVQNAERDRFILSKGHCALGFYAALHEFGFISDTELASFHSEGGEFQTHAVKNVAKGIEISSGSLAMGFSMACGIATALAGKGLASRVFVLVGNGEANEGLFWEAAMFAGAKALSNMCVVMDDNGMQNDGNSSDVLPVSNWDARMKAFGWTSLVVDGHDSTALRQAFEAHHPTTPLFVLAKTVKGKGVPFMENSPLWHHSKMNPQQYAEAMEALA